MRGALSLLAIALCATGCLWYEPMTRVIEPVSPDRPNTVTGRRAEIEATRAAKDNPLQLPEGVTMSTPKFNAAPTIHVVLPGDIHFITRPWDTTISGHTAHIRLTLRNGESREKTHALALLTAHVVADAPRASEGKPSLRASIEDLGGTLQVGADRFTTYFGITLPDENWQPGLDFLLDAIQTTPVSRQQADKVQDRLLRQLSLEQTEDVLEPVLHRIIGQRAGTNAFLTALQDIDATQIVLHHKLTYLPGGAVLALLVPDTDGPKLMTSLLGTLKPWTDLHPATKPTAPLEAPEISTGVHWAERDSSIRMAFLRTIPEPTGSDAAAALITNEIITWDGVGGRFGEALGLSFGVEAGLTSYQIVEGGVRYQVLEASVTSAQVAQAYAAFNVAVKSLRSVPPSRHEVKVAASRARLRLLADQNDPDRWLGQATRAALTGSPILGKLSATGLAEEEQASKSQFVTTLEGLERPETLELGAAALRMAAVDITVVAIGGAIPDGIELDIETLEDVFVEESRGILRVDPAQTKVAGDSYLEHALEVVGGKRRIAMLDGFSAVSTSRSGRSPILEDQVWLRTQKGLLFRRLRTILQTTIETKAWPTGGNETSGEMRFKLERDEVKNLFDSATRHPLLILSEYARGKSTYKLISERTVRDRRIAVLERNDPNRERLRLHIDVESGLIRTIEGRERRAGVGFVFVHDEFRDYRRTDGLRIPFHRTAYVDNTVDGIVTEWTIWQPGAPTPEQLGSKKKQATVDKAKKPNGKGTKTKR